jgi:hypothetical protein
MDKSLRFAIDGSQALLRPICSDRGFSGFRILSQRLRISGAFRPTLVD